MSTAQARPARQGGPPGQPALCHRQRAAIRTEGPRDRDTPVRFGQNGRVAKRRDPAPLADLLGQVLGRVAADTGSAAAIQPVWSQVVGPVVARHAWCARLTQGTLAVACDSGQWRDELALQTAELLGRLRARLGSSAPERLTFELGQPPGERA